MLGRFVLHRGFIEFFDHVLGRYHKTFHNSTTPLPNIIQSNLIQYRLIFYTVTYSTISPLHSIVLYSAIPFYLFLLGFHSTYMICWVIGIPIISNDTIIFISVTIHLI